MASKKSIGQVPLHVQVDIPTMPPCTRANNTQDGSVNRPAACHASLCDKEHVDSPMLLLPKATTTASATVGDTSSLSTPPTSPAIVDNRRRQAAAPGGPPPAVEGGHRSERRPRYVTYDAGAGACQLRAAPSAAPETAASAGTSVDRAVRALMAELDASIFRNVASAVSAFFLDVNDVGHFVSMPHLGACASPEANHIMRLIEETLTKHAAYLLDPTDRHGLELFGDALAQRVSSDPRVLTPLAKVLIVLRLGHTATAARQGNHPAVTAMVGEYPLYMDAQVQTQAHKVSSPSFSSLPLPTAGQAPDTAAGLHRSTSLTAAAHVHFASPPASPSATQIAFGAPATAIAAGPRTRKRVMSTPATPTARLAAAAPAPKTEVAVVLESMVATPDTRLRHPVYLLHVQDAAAAAAGARRRSGSPTAFML